jgi:hypothetical protein
MKTVNIFLFLVIIILVSMIVGLTLSNKVKNKEEFVTKIYPTPSVPRCIRNNRDEENMERKSQRPPCFFNDIDNINKDLIGLNAKIRDRTDDIVRKSVMIDDNLLNRALDGSKKVDLILRSDDLANFNKHMLDTTNKMFSNKKEATKIISKLTTTNVSLDEAQTMNKIQLEVSKMVSNAIDRIVSSSSQNIGQSIQQKFTKNHANSIINKLSALIYDKINNNISGDVNDMVNKLVEKQKLDQVIVMSIENEMRNDKAFAPYMPGGNNNLKIGDYVYFKHTVSNNIPDLCIDEPSQREIILGGKICNLDPITNKAKINYLFVSNPNFNNRCSKNFAYDKGVSGLPKWYAPAGQDVRNKCGLTPFNDAACLPNQWPTDKDTWVSKYIGGFDRKKNEMLCGVGPTISNDYPSEVNIANLSKSLEDVVKSCKNNKLSVNQQKVIPLPKPQFNPSKKYELPMPKNQELPPPSSGKTKQQIERERLMNENKKKLQEQQERERKELELLNKNNLQLDNTQNIQRRKGEQMQLNESPGRKQRQSQQQQVKKDEDVKKSFKINQNLFNVQQKRDELILANRCIDATKDDSKEDRYLTDSNKNRYRIINGKIMMGRINSKMNEADKELKLPGNIQVAYLYRKAGQGNLGKVLAYGKNKKWYHYAKDEKTEQFAFKEITKVELDSDDFTGELDPNGTCVVGNTI